MPVSSLADDIVLRNRTQRICEGRSYHSPANCDRIMLVLSTVEHNYLVVDVCYLLHKYQLHVSVLMAIFRLNELTKNIDSYIWHASYILWRGEGGLLDGGPRSPVY